MAADLLPAVAAHRYTEWRVWSHCRADWSDPQNLEAAELYDHSDDTGLGRAVFESFENENIANLPGSAAVVAQLAAALRGQFEHGGAAQC